MRLRHLLPAVAAALALARPLAGQNPYPLDTLRVHVGSRADPRLPSATRAVEVVTAAELRRLPTRTLADALAWALGVDVQARSPAQADLGLRGSGPEQVLLLVNGVRATDPQTGHFALDQAIPLDEVQRIEVLRGPASALYGADAMGGVINIVTRGWSGGPGEVGGRVEGGTFGTAGLRLRAGSGPGEVAGSVAGELERSDGFRPGTDYRGGSARGSASLATGSRMLRADLAWEARDFGARAFYTPPQAPFDEFEKTRTVSLLLGWEGAQDARLALEPRLSVRRHDDDFVLKRAQPSFYQNVHRSWQVGGELAARTALPRVKVAGGVEGYRDLLRSTNLGDRNESRAAGFAELSAGGSAGAALSAGARVDWHSRYGAFFAPSLAGALRLAPPLRLRASVGRAFRAPTWTERYYVDPSNQGNPELRPEHAWEVETGAELGSARARLAAGVWLRRASNLIDWIARPGTSGAATVWEARNLGRVTFRGVEVEGRAQDPLGTRWQLRTSALSFDADQAVATSKYALRPLTRSASLSADRTVLGPVAAALRFGYARRPGQPGWWLLDARLHTGWHGAELYLDGRNLTGARYLDVSAMPAPGRALYVGLGWSPGGRREAEPAGTSP